MSEVKTNIKVAFALAVLLTTVLAIVANTPSHAQQTGYSCHIKYTYAERSYGSYQNITIVNTGDYNLRLRPSTPIQWIQNNVEDIDYGINSLKGWDYFDPTVRLYPQRTRIAPGASYGGWGMIVYQTESAAPDPDSFSIGGLLCTSEQIESSSD